MCLSVRHSYLDIASLYLFVYQDLMPLLMSELSDPFANVKLVRGNVLMFVLVVIRVLLFVRIKNVVS